MWRIFYLYIYYVDNGLAFNRGKTFFHFWLPFFLFELVVYMDDFVRERRKERFALMKRRVFNSTSPTTSPARHSIIIIIIMFLFIYMRVCDFF